MDSIASQEVLTIGYNRQTQQDNVSRGEQLATAIIRGEDAVSQLSEN